MADAYLLENGTDHYLLEDGSGVYLLDVPTTTYTLAPDLGTYAQTGNSVTLTHQYNLTVSAGSYSQTGNSIAFSYSGATYKLQTTLGTYAQTGNDIGLSHAYKLYTTLGTYAQTGNDPTLFYNTGEQFTLNFLFDLLPADTGLATEYAERLTVDGTEIDVISWTFREENGALTGKLDLELFAEDRSLITGTSVIKFEIGNDSSGAMVYETLFDTGLLERSDYHIQRLPDSFTITTKPTMLVKLEKTPTHGSVLYDPLKQEIDTNDWPIIKDTNNNSYTPTFTAQNDLDLYTILNAAFVTGCGFSAVHTNIPNYGVSIVEFRAGDSYMNSIGGIIGMFDPDFSAIGDVLYIRDGTAGLPAGMPAPRQITCSDARSMGVTADHQKVNAILLTYIADVRPYDFFSDRTESETDTNGTGHGVVGITTDTHYRDYYRNTNLLVPTRTEITSKDTTIKTYVLELGTFWVYETIETATETFTYSTLGDTILRVKTTQKRLPNPDNSYSIEMIDYEDEREIFQYTQHPFKPMRRYCKFRQSITTAPILTDSDNQQLGQNYSQELLKVYQAGNVQDVMTAERGPVYSLTETGTPLRSGRVRFHVNEIDHAVGVSIRNFEEERDGELGITSTVREPRQIYVLQDDVTVRNTDRIVELHGGETPVTSVGIPLARRRLLQLNTFPNRLSLEYIGIDNTLQKGTAVTALGRDGDDLGNYIIEARTLTGSRNGHFMSFEVKQANV